METSSNLSQEPLDFHFREFESLKKEIAVSISEERILERYTIVGTGIVWVWLLANPNMEIPKIGWWIPLLFAVLSALRSFTLLLSIRRMAKYIKQIEIIARFSSELPGWEHYCEENRLPFISISAGLFWAITLLSTAIAPFFMAP
ncbi:MAG: hypothetical protein GY862_07275 [Gammaproteobacteria bacterium]|nr:hypothetical protein [Gammaproteobacteria bacterium]